VGREQILSLSGSFEGSFITKHNQGGKGLGIQKFESTDALAAHLDSPDFDPGPDGKIILQQYIQSPEPRITRVELLGNRMLYAMYSSTTQGFELCPSDACQLKSDVCPADGSSDKFSLRPLTPDDPLVQQYLRLMRNTGISVAGIEFIEDEKGRRYTYDINGTTNYSGALIRETGIDGMAELAGYIRRRVVPRLRMLRAS
jgi:glutathione synthase/RimK-type ligase-like ATP-grasp enzyme